MPVRLRAMSDDEFGEWFSRSQASYLIDRMEAGEPEDIARQRVAGQYAEYVPDGLPGPRRAVLAIDV